MSLTGRVVFSSGISVDFDVWCLDLESGGLLQLTHGDNVNDFPRWSPDGSHIAYISIQEDLIPSIWIMRADGQGKRRLTTNIYCQAPSWSPDGKQLIFTSNATDSSEIEVCTMGLDGTAPSRLFKYNGIEETPSYSLDGEHVLFSAPALDEDGLPSMRDTEIIEYNIKEGSFRMLCPHPAKDYAPSYSPEGGRIAFVSHRNDQLPDDYRAAYQEFREIIRNGTNAEARAAMVCMNNFEHDGDIFVMKSDGTDLIQLTHDSLADNGVCWSPCGNYLMYTSALIKQQGTACLKVIDARSGKLVQFSYDRTAFEQEIGSLKVVNATVFQQITPDFIEKMFVQGSFWGEERRPHWIR